MSPIFADFRIYDLKIASESRPTWTQGAAPSSLVIL
jgi:hypothetical protein